MKYYLKHLYVPFYALLLIAFLLISGNRASAGNISVVHATAKIAVCGNNIKENGEQCDLSDLGGQSCSNLGFNSGTLACSFSCEYDTTGCVTNSTANAGTDLSPTSDETYIFTDGNHSLDIFLPQGFFDTDLSLFLFSHDSTEFSSTKPAPDGENFIGKLFNLVFANNNGDSVHNLAKTSTVTLSYSALDLGTIDENTLIPYRSEEGSSLWTAIPNFTQDKTNKTITFSADQFSYFTIMGSIFSGGNNIGPGGGGGSLPKVSKKEKEKILKVADFNHDGQINIIDLSILLYYYGRSDSTALQYDLNNDGIIDISDASIMLYYWEVT